MNIILKEITKKFGQKTILKSVNLHLEEGKTHVLLGSSGCGKSTLMRIISGVIQPDEGEVWLNQQLMTPSTQRSLVRQIGYVVQEGGLFPHLTSEENVRILAKTFGFSAEQTNEKLNQLAELVGLSKAVLSRYPKELSGGQRQRVSIMRACFHDPAIMLLDEPLGALDPIIRAELQSELKRIFKQLRKTVVLVTHDIGEAAYFGDTVTLFRQGKIVQHGAFVDLLNQPKEEFVTQFINAQKTLHDMELSP